MKIDDKKFKVVIIDYPIHLLNDPFATTLLGKALKMKYDGYAHTYHDGILPMDKTDFFGTHLMLCEEINGELEPVFAYKSVSLDRCNKHDHEFPIVTALKTDAHPSCLRDIWNIINNTSDASTVSYDSSWAQNLNYRQSSNLQMKNTLREIMTMIIVMHHKTFNLPHMITCGVVKVKTDLFFIDIGLKKLNSYSKFPLRSLSNEESVLFYNNAFSKEAYDCCEKQQKLWDDRLTFNGLMQSQTSARKAS